MTGQLNISGNRITELGAPVETSDASTAAFVLENAEILKEGVISRDGTPSATMQVDLNLDFNRITAVVDPTGAQDAATKAYVDRVGGADIRKRADAANKQQQAVCRPIGGNSHTSWSAVPLPLRREQQCLEPCHWLFHSPHRWGMRRCGELADQVGYSWRQPW